MAGGRLDEAFQILQASEQRNHRDGQRLTDRLIAAFVDRATEHLQQEHLRDARCDAERARLLGGRQQQVAELLHNIAAAESEQRQRSRQRDEVLASAQQQMRLGAFTAGAKLLDGLKQDASATTAAAADQLAASLESGRAVLQQATDTIQQAIREQDYEAAVSVLARLQPDEQHAAQVVSLARQAVLPLVDQAMDQLAAGRIDRAMATHEILTTLQRLPAEADELRRSLTRCHTIQQLLTSHQYAEAETQLGTLAQMLAGSRWVEEARSALSEIVRRLSEVAAGPLGLSADAATDHAGAAVARMEAAASPAGHAPQMGAPPRVSGLAARSVLQVDGLGRLLVLTGDVVSVGAASGSSARVDVPLLTEGENGVISIRRDGEDYFAEATHEFQVNGQPVTRRLLESGDSIAVGNRGRLKFLKTVAVSSSAVLQITGSRLVQREIRSVVLMADSLLFGAAGSHFRLDGVSPPVVLHGGHDGFALRESVAAGAPGRVTQRPPSVPLVDGHSVLMNDVRFALSEADR